MENLLNPDPGLIIWTLIAFGIVVFILRKYAWNPILTALDTREKSIEQSLLQAEKARQEMAKLKSDNEAILQQAKEERSAILKEARELHEKIVNDAKEKARAESLKIVESAKKEIENQKLAALTEVKNQVGLMALDISSKILKKEMKQNNNHEGYVSELVEELKLN